jgi:hypothetical protein
MSKSRLKLKPAAGKDANLRPRPTRKHPALLEILELEALSALAKNSNARIYISFDKHVALHGDGDSGKSSSGELQTERKALGRGDGDCAGAKARRGRDQHGRQREHLPSLPSGGKSPTGNHLGLMVTEER